MPRPLVIFHPEQCTMKITTISSITEKSNVSAYTPTEKQKWLSPSGVQSSHFLTPLRML